MKKLTYEEKCIMECYQGKDRENVIKKMSESIPYLEGEMRMLVEKTKNKIEDMTDIEFTQLLSEEDKL